MNTRDYKTFASGEYYHVYNRGVGKMDLFKDEQDYNQFIIRLKLALGIDPRDIKELSKTSTQLRIRPVEKGAFTLVCYCIMPNHYHFLIRQNTDMPISTLMSKICTSYSMYFNKRYGRVGPIFQDSFKAVNVDGNNYILWLSAYIHQNPSVAGLVWDLSQWQWSSYPEYIDGVGGITDKGIILEQYKSAAEYRRFVETSYDAIRKNKLMGPTTFD